MNNYELVVMIDGVAFPGPRELNEKTGARHAFNISTRDNDTGETLEETYTFITDDPSIASVIRHRSTGSHGEVFHYLVLPSGPGRARVTIRGNQSGAEYELDITVTGAIKLFIVRTDSGDWLEGDKIRVNGSGTLEADLETWNRSVPVTWTSSDPSVLVVADAGIDPDLKPYQQTERRATVHARAVGKATVTATLANGKKEEIQIEVIKDRLSISGPDTVGVEKSIVLEVSSTHPDDRFFQWTLGDPTVADLQLLDGSGKKVRITGLRVGKTKVEVLAPTSQLKEEIELTVSSELEDEVTLTADKEVIAPEQSLPVTAQTRQGGQIIVESYTWTSSQPEVLVVENATGVSTSVRGVASGTVTLTAKGDTTGLEGTLTLAVGGVEVSGPSFIKPHGHGNYVAKTSVGPNPFFEWKVEPPSGVVSQDPNAEKNTLHGRVEGAVEITATANSSFSGSKLVAVTKEPVMLIFQKPDPQNPKKPPVGPSHTTIGRSDRPNVFLFATGQVKKGTYELTIAVFSATLFPQYVVKDGSGVRFEESSFEPKPFAKKFKLDSPVLGQKLFQLPPIPSHWNSPMVVVVSLRRNGVEAARDQIEIHLR